MGSWILYFLLWQTQFRGYFKCLLFCNWTMAFEKWCNSNFEGSVKKKKNLVHSHYTWELRYSKITVLTSHLSNDCYWMGVGAGDRYTMLGIALDANIVALQFLRMCSLFFKLYNFSNWLSHGIITESFFVALLILTNTWYLALRICYLT